ncbi:MAG: hypothetical protein ACD_57C00030G0001 [uncultured bacterium]|nr:MAG: hypothetical protein ACD_57C00030G0001 [uncultured bacterium]KKT75306.1 MAG: Polysaccharide biosynthesis protein [Microgenomates group bacterium GW2011_GWA2_44_7]KKT78610.1 MAG: Polysaccharide biosynthesis protein [Microgenomates group bacterium GW2011_GWB1_44_8]
MKYFARPLLYIAIGNGVFALSGYAIHFFLGRYLGPSLYGVYGVIIALMTTVNIILTTGIPNALSKYVTENPGIKWMALKRAIILQLSFSLAVGLIYFFCADLIALALNDHTLAKYIRLSALIFPAYSLYSLFSGFYNGLHLFDRQSYLLSVYSLSKALLVIVLVMLIKVYGAIMGFIIAPIVALLFVARIKTVDMAKTSIKSVDTEKILKFAIPMTIFSVVSMLIISIDLFMIKALLGQDRLVGFYTAASVISKTPNVILSALTIVSFPIVVHANRKGNRLGLKKTIKDSIILSTICILVVSLPIFIFSGQIITASYSSLYQEAAPILAILTVGVGFFSLFEVLSAILNALGHPKTPMYIGLFALLPAILLNYFLIPKFSLSGAALSTAISSFVVMAMALYKVLKLTYTQKP